MEVHGLVAAGPVLVGLTDGFLMAFDKQSGRAAWEIPQTSNEHWRFSSVTVTLADNSVIVSGPRT